MLTSVQSSSDEFNVSTRLRTCESPQFLRILYQGNANELPHEYFLCTYGYSWLGLNTYKCKYIVFLAENYTYGCMQFVCVSFSWLALYALHIQHNIPWNLAHTSWYTGCTSNPSTIIKFMVQAIPILWQMRPNKQTGSCAILHVMSFATNV